MLSRRQCNHFFLNRHKNPIFITTSSNFCFFYSLEEDVVNISVARATFECFVFSCISLCCWSSRLLQVASEILMHLKISLTRSSRKERNNSCVPSRMNHGFFVPQDFNGRETSTSKMRSGNRDKPEVTFLCSVTM